MEGKLMIDSLRLKRLRTKAYGVFPSLEAMENGEEDASWKEALRQVADLGYPGPKERAACRCAVLRSGTALSE